MDLPVLPTNAPTPAPRACRCCAIAKSKCVQLPDTTHGRCARCLRLKKTCIPAPTAVRKRKAPKQTRTAKLEEKIESLVTLLSQTQSTVSIPENILPVATVNELLPKPSPTPIEPVIGNNEKPEHVAPCCHLPPPSAQLRTAGPSALDFSHGLEPSPIDAVNILNNFCSNYTQWFPFVVVPLDISAQELKLQKPHLYRSIMMVASNSQPLKQMAMGKEIVQVISMSLIMNGEKSLDLLQALLVYTCWNFYHFILSPRMTSLLQLALGLMFDMRLNTSHQIDGDDIFIYGKLGVDDETVKDTSITDEQRAYLGCWVLASAMSLCFRRIDSLRHSPHLDYCCDSLSSLAEYPTDAFAVAIVRLQIITERIQDVLIRSRNSHQKVTVMAPIGMHVNLFRDELQRFKASLPTIIQEDIHFEIQYHCAEIHLYEVSISQPPGTDYGSYPLQRIDMLYACLTACQDFFSANRKITTRDFPNLSFLTFARLAPGIATFFKLSLLRMPGWDVQHVRQTVNIAEFIDSFITKFQEARAYIDAKGEMKKTDAFSRCAWKLSRVKIWYEQKLKAETGADQQLNMPGAVHTDGFEFQPFDPISDLDWQQYLGDWEIPLS